MKVIRAKSAGFCWELKGQFRLPERKHRVVGELYTDGPLIHNSQMMDALGKEDIREVGDYQSTSDLDLPKEEEKESVVVVRAHGISPQRRKYLKDLGLPFSMVPVRM